MNKRKKIKTFTKTGKIETIKIISYQLNITWISIGREIRVNMFKRISKKNHKFWSVLKFRIVQY